MGADRPASGVAGDGTRPHRAVVAGADGHRRADLFLAAAGTAGVDWRRAVAAGGHRVSAGAGWVTGPHRAGGDDRVRAGVGFGATRDVARTAAAGVAKPRGDGHRD